MKNPKARRRGRKESGWILFDAVNYRLFLIGILVIIIGYILMMQGPHDSFWSLHLSPVVLVVGYCVLLPIALLLRAKKTKGD
jgi:uncharacterized membrane protein HdeD (DUF308 family)